MEGGWIKLHRQLTNHWLYNEKRKFSKLEAWLDILFTVNFTASKTMIKGKLIEVNRGESILSLDSWANRWNWDKSAVRRFFDLLQKQHMIVIKNETVTTRLIVCKYDSYQSEDLKSDTQMKRRRHANETQTTPIEEREERKEGKEGKENNINERKLKFAESLKDFVPIYGRDMIKEFYDYWSEPNKSNTKFKQEMQATWSLESRLRTWSKNNEKFNTFKNGISTKQTMDERIAEAKRRASEKRSGQMPSIWGDTESFSDYETIQ